MIMIINKNDLQVTIRYESIKVISIFMYNNVAIIDLIIKTTLQYIEHNFLNMQYILCNIVY